MENQFKLRISRMFRSSFGSCKSKNITDVIERPALLSENENQGCQNHHRPQLIELFSPKPRPFPSLCRPRWPESFQTEQGCIVSKNLFARSKVTERRSLLLAADFMEGQKCPPASPASPFNLYTHEFQDSDQFKPKMIKRQNKKTINRRVRARSRTKSCGIHEFPAFSYNGLFSSDDENEDEDEDDKTTLFSSRSLSSDSSESFRRTKAYRSNKAAAKNPPRRRTARKDREFKTGPLVPLEAKVKDSFAVVKRSSDPYSDFRTSMVEMIIEKQIFSGKDLENLLQCFLSLNSYHHHRVIIQVFTEIWEALFFNWS